MCCWSVAYNSNIVNIVLFECSNAMDLRISHLHGSSSSISVREDLKGEGDGATEEAFTEEGCSIHSIVFKKKNIVLFTALRHPFLCVKSSKEKEMQKSSSSPKKVNE